MDKIAVLMSTYNGAQFLGEQIDSILSQKNVCVHLFVRDDCSSDSTMDVLTSYADNCSNITVFFGKKNLGPEKSYKKLLKTVLLEHDKFEYYAYADQDDIWLPNKLNVAVNKLSGIRKPALYASNQYIYKDDAVVGLRFKQAPNYSLLYNIHSNSLSGCTMVFNRSLAVIMLEKLYPDDYFRFNKMHDTWTALTAGILGIYIYDPNAYILYRQHGANVVGIKKEGIIEKIKQQSKRKNMKRDLSRCLIRCFGNELKQEREAIELLSMYDRNWKNKFVILKKAKKYHYFYINKLLLLLKVALGTL